ncbi:MAG: spore cortex-lytic enzyme [Clostridia bacterium]|nr:spore cortex-lytic enzyme [Clostridia bacterium]
MRITKRALLALILITALLLPLAAGAASLSYGSRGEDVKKVQTRLKNWGYYNGAVDGIFGSGTLAAVKAFQRKNGLAADGIVGPKTAAALGITIGVSDQSASSGDVWLLGKVIYGEARGEPYKGQVAIGAVVLNRVKSPSFPNTIAGVIYQRGAFDAVSDGQINLSPDSTAVRAARDALNGWDPTYGCLFYYNPATATSRWMLARPVILRIGNHAFC